LNISRTVSNTNRPRVACFWLDFTATA